LPCRACEPPAATCPHAGYEHLHMSDRLSELPSEIIHNICLNLASQRVPEFLRLRCASNVLKHAVDVHHAELWTAVLLAQFPRARRLLAYAPQHFTNGNGPRQLYRDQLWADEQRVRSMFRPVGELSNLLFTFELAFEGEPPCAEWCGKLDDVRNLRFRDEFMDDENHAPPGNEFPCMWFDEWPTLMLRPELGVLADRASAAWMESDGPNWGRLGELSLTIFVTHIEWFRTAKFYQGSVCWGDELSTHFAETEVLMSTAVPDGLISCEPILHDGTCRISLRAHKFHVSGDDHGIL